jgi:RNA polymerase sigma-70 factor (ECF subfamily)
VARDERALEELVTLATPWLLGVAQSMLGDADEAEEVVAAAFQTIWNNAVPAMGDLRGLMPYLLRVTRHRAIDRLRARRRARRKLERLARLDLEPPVVSPVEPNELAHPGWQVHAQVHAALAELPENQRMAVQLAYFEGLTQSEVAQRLDIPLGTVKTRLRLAFDRLRVSLAHVKDWIP